MASQDRVALLAATLCLISGGCTTVGFGEPSYGDELSVLDGTGDVSGEQVTLSDGSELAVGYVGDGEFAAQWRDPEGEGWTEPETVIEGEDLDASSVTLKADGATAVAGFTWYAADDDEQESFARTDAAVCRDLSCDAIEGVGSPTLAQDGELAVVSLPSDVDVTTDPAAPYEVSTWSADGGGWEEATVEGPPMDMPSYLRPELVVLDDGRLATVRADDSDGCRYELWAGEPRSTELTVAARAESTGAGACFMQDVRGKGNDVVFSTSSAGDTASFTPAGDGWTDSLS